MPPALRLIFFSAAVAISFARPTEAADSGWWHSISPPSARMSAAMVFDGARDRWLLVGGFDGVRRLDVWSLDAAGAWTELAPLGGGPAPRHGHTVVHDPAGDRLILFGGTDGVIPFGDAWILDLGAGTPAWLPVTWHGPGPSPRSGHAAVFDSALGQLLVIGGDDGGALPLADAWRLDLGGNAAWSPVQAQGAIPPGRFGHSAALDPDTRRVLVYGGHDGSSLLGDVHTLALDDGTWGLLAPTGAPPPARHAHVAAWDAVTQSMVVFGGVGQASLRNDAWALRAGVSAEWTALFPGGTPPTARSGSAAGFDPGRRRLLVVGGNDGELRCDALALALETPPTWLAIAPEPPMPSARYRQAAVEDPAGRRLVTFGGFDGTVPYPSTVGVLDLDDDAWGPAHQPIPAPSGRYGHSAIRDSWRNRMVVFGGHDGTGPVGETWALSLPGADAWARWTAAIPSPPSRQNHTAVEDPRRDRMIVFGGFGSARRNDTWALTLGDSPAWTALAPAGTPPSARSNHVAILDPARDRMIVFGGSDGVLRNDVWALSLAEPAAWTLLATAGTHPSPRAGHTAIYDPVRDRMVVFGGDDGTFRADAWALSLAGIPTWSPLSPDGAAPPGRRFHVAIYDDVRDRMLVLGGWNGAYRGDAAALAWNAAARPTTTGASGPGVAAPGSIVERRYVLRHALPGTRAVAWAFEDLRAWPGVATRGVRNVAAAAETIAVTIAVPDTAAPGAIVLELRAWFVGAAGCDSTWREDLAVGADPVGVLDLATADVDRIAWVSPNPFRDAYDAGVMLARGGRVRLQLFDVAGRACGEPIERWLPAGRNSLRLEPPRSLPAGVYLLRLESGGRVHTRRVVALR